MLGRWRSSHRYVQLGPSQKAAGESGVRCYLTASSHIQSDDFILRTPSAPQLGLREVGEITHRSRSDCQVAGALRIGQKAKGMPGPMSDPAA